MRRVIAMLCLTMCLCLAAAMPAAAQAPEPNQDAHVTLSAASSYEGGVSVFTASIPVTNRFSVQVVNALAPSAGIQGLSFHTIEVEYARNLANLFGKGSKQVNLERFFIAGSAGGGSVRNADASGGANPAASAAGRLSLCVKKNDTGGCDAALDLVNVRYFFSSIARPQGGAANGDAQASAGFRWSF